MIARRSPKVEGARQQGTRIALSGEELAFVRGRAKKKGVSISRLVRRSIARDAASDGDVPPTTLCTADDYTEGLCAR